MYNIFKYATIYLNLNLNYLKLVIKLSEEAKISGDLESMRQSLVEKYKERMNFRDKEVYNLSRELDKKIIEYMEKAVQNI
ncbi:MAG: hypothetical protein PWR10_974 [Halanaerobiales bacterium]|nr:hypothetical protein [Halanaerobiales bacterium]